MATVPKNFTKKEIFDAIAPDSWQALLACSALPAFVQAIDMKARDDIKMWADVFRLGTAPILKNNTERIAINAICNATVIAPDPQPSPWTYTLAALKNTTGGIDVTATFTNSVTGDVVVKTMNAPDMSKAKADAQALVHISVLDARDAALASYG
jgi:hypothetical protein